MSSLVKNIEISRVSGRWIEPKDDLLAVEEPLEIHLGYGSREERQQKSLSVTMRTPGHDFELALGFLFTEGIIRSPDKVENIQYCENVGRQEERENVLRVELKSEVRIDFQKLQRNFYTSSSCGVCGKSSIESVQVHCKHMHVDWKVASEFIHLLPEKLKSGQQVFKHTGGLHASGLFNLSGELVLAREDVGRHNALDKVIGAMLTKESFPLSAYILVVSGRASFELVQKAAVAGIPILAAVGAPSSLAVSLAEGCGMTLLGFVRDNRFNIYSVPERITN